MSFKYVVNRIICPVRKVYDKFFILLCLLSIAQASLAADSNGGVIPISSDDQTKSQSDFATTIVHIIQKDILPFVELLGAVWVLWTAIATMANGVKEAQERQKFDPLKNAIIKTVIIVVVGGALLYLLDRLRGYQFTS